MHIRNPYRALTGQNQDFAPYPRGISFRHPAIPRKDGNVLFILGGHDSYQGFLHYEIARLACAIIAGNQWSGYLTRSPTGPPIDVAADGLLKDKDYYFVVPRPDEDQPLSVQPDTS